MSYLEENNIKAVAFDIDGTLYPKSETNRILVKTSLFHLPFALKYMNMRSQIREEDGLSDLPLMSSDEFKKREMDIMYPRCDKSLAWFKEKEMKVFYDKWDKEFLHIKAFDGMAPFLRELKNRVAIALLSDFPIGVKLKALGIEGVADFVISSEDIGRLKPSKGPFNVLIDYFKLPPDQILYVGDSERKDIMGAKNAGMKALLITKNKKKVKDSNADVIVSSFFEMGKVLL